MEVSEIASPPQGDATRARLASHPMLHGHRPMGPYLRRILRALAEVVLPLGPTPPPTVNEDLDRVALFVSRYACFMPRLLRIALPLGLLTLELGAFVLAPSLRPFTKMTLQRRKKYVNSWVHSRSRLFRDLIKGLKGICFLGYYSDPVHQAELEYTPQEHVVLVKAERLKRHADQL